MTIGELENHITDAFVGLSVKLTAIELYGNKYEGVEAPLLAREEIDIEWNPYDGYSADVRIQNNSGKYAALASLIGEDGKAMMTFEPGDYPNRGVPTGCILYLKAGDGGLVNMDNKRITRPAA